MINYFKEIDIDYIKFITEYINLHYPNKRKPKYNTYYYVSNIFYILKTGIQWNALLTKAHYTTIYKKFIYWNELKIFDNIYNDLLKKYINNNIIKNTYIDASHIMFILYFSIISIKYKEFS